MKRAMSDRNWDAVRDRLRREEEARRVENECATCSVCGAPCRRDGEGIWHHTGPCDEQGGEDE